jgi:hypothetical protein
MLLQNLTLLMLYTVAGITSVAHSDSALLVCCASTAASGDSSESDAPAVTSVITSVETSAPTSAISNTNSDTTTHSTSSTSSSSGSVWCTAGITQSTLPLLDTLRSLQRCGTAVTRLQLYLSPLLNAALHVVNSSSSATTAAVIASATTNSANDDSGDGNCVALSAAVQQVLSEEQSSSSTNGVYSVWEELSGAATAARVQVLLCSLRYCFLILKMAVTQLSCCC